MWTYPFEYDVIVVGGGHAGCEAAYAAARSGASTLLLSMSLDTLAKMSCNPAIGGTAKGHIVREIDALGGIMGKVADETSIQFRMLNASKGPAVWSPRAQSDKHAYSKAMKERLEKVDNLELREGSVESLLVSSDRIEGLYTQNGVLYKGKTVILTTGTFLRGLIHLGSTSYSGGRAGEKPSNGLSASLESLGLKLGRLKTGTPPRIHRKSINFSLLEEQPGDPGFTFSFDERQTPMLPQVSCHITYSTPQTKKIILDNLSLSAMYSGKIESIGPRYCPSIEDKIVRFSDKERHQFFLEPEGLSTDEIYISGLSSSMPPGVQYQIVRSVIGLEKAEIMRYAYAIEYDFVTSGQLFASLETKQIEGLFLAGQINGTTGYEEAAAQGLLAGINAGAKLQNKAPLILSRSEAYIGVMIDELTSKEIFEPYRMFTSRAEHRLLLRQDNADLRLRSYGFEYNLITEEQMKRLKTKKEHLEKGTLELKSTYKPCNDKSASLYQILCRPDYTYQKLLSEFPDFVVDYGLKTNEQIELNCKYAGYLERQEKEVARLQTIENICIPKEFDFKKLKGLRNEAKEKLAHYTPYTVGQASRIAGVSPADITILMVALK
jgi:tRNA uridine 5-carboxymethylaminomethyl modification enzyme